MELVSNVSFFVTKRSWEPSQQQAWPAAVTSGSNLNGGPHARLIMKEEKNSAHMKKELRGNSMYSKFHVYFM